MSAMSIEADPFAPTALGAVPGGAPRLIPIDSRANLQRAVAVLLAGARRNLDWAERDLSRFNLTLRTHTEQIERMLLADRYARVRLLVDDPAWIEAQAARLRRLHRAFPHALHMRQTLPEDPVGDEAFGIVDQLHGLRLMPIEITSGELWLNDPSRSSPWRDGFDRRWENAGYNLPAFTLGL
jgi:hypothetical protein